MDPGLKRLPAHFYRLDSGKEPVREWLKELEPEDRKAIGEDIKDVGVFMACRHAARSSAGSRIVGSQECLAAWPNCAGSFLCRAEQHGAASRLYQKDP